MTFLLLNFLMLSQMHCVNTFRTPVKLELLLKELMDLQKDMVVMLLSMLEGSFDLYLRILYSLKDSVYACSGSQPAAKDKISVLKWDRYLRLIAGLMTLFF